MGLNFWYVWLQVKKSMNSDIFSVGPTAVAYDRSHCNRAFMYLLQKVCCSVLGSLSCLSVRYSCVVWSMIPFLVHVGSVLVDAR